MPQDPELHGENWDGMEESIYNGICDLGESKVSIFWSDYYDSPGLPPGVKYRSVYIFDRIVDLLVAEYPGEPVIDTEMWLRRTSGDGEPIEEALLIPRPPFD
ncbi:hypothetical protein GCM10027447_25690 [Glycomyces halotolerans]